MQCAWSEDSALTASHLLRCLVSERWRAYGVSGSEKRRRQILKRQREAQEQRSARGQVEREEARRELERKLRGASRRLWITRLLWLAAGVVVVVHLLAHSGWRPIPLTMGWQDLLIGYPMAGALALAALFAWGSTPAHR